MGKGTLLTHTLVASQRIMNRYAKAFIGDSSIAVVADTRVDVARKQPWLAGWDVTDCSTNFERSAFATRGSDEELLIETSGTVGEPKMVRYQKSVIRDCATTIAEALSLSTARDYVALVNPRFAYGLSVVHSHLAAAVPVHFETPPVSLGQWAALRGRLRPSSSVYLTPHHSFLLAQDPQWRLEGPIELIFAGGLVTQSMVDHLERSFPDAIVTNMYGQAELGPRVSIGRAAINAFREGDVGTPLPGVRVRFGEQEADRGGMIFVDSPFHMMGYVNLAGAEPERGIRGNGWWRTGDVGHRGNDGRINVTGRAADDINFLGTRVRPDELRAVTRAVPGVLDARVSVNKHDRYGQQPSLRVLVEARDQPFEVLVRKALANAIGASAGAVQITIVDWTTLPESGKL